MVPDTSQCPSTDAGVQDLLHTLRPAIQRMWKAERCVLGDDLVAVISVDTNAVHLKSRKSAIRTMRKETPGSEVIRRLARAPEARAGTVKIWTVLGFDSGAVLLSPLVLAES